MILQNELPPDHTHDDHTHATTLVIDQLIDPPAVTTVAIIAQHVAPIS
jgi:hypothetical protein